MNLALWLELLLALFVLRVDPERDPANPDPQPEPEPEPDPQPEFSFDSSEPEPEPRADTEPDSAAQLAEERKARQAAEQRNQEYERRETEARLRSQPAPRSDEEKLREQEERKLADPKTTELERWQINSNRTLRANQSASVQALAQANDVADSTRFSQLAVTKPAIYNRYKDRVEAELVKMRQNGQSAPREAILRFLIGNDAIDGKLTRKKAAPAADTPSSPRGGRLPPGAKTDVQVGKGMSEREKRAKRLEGVNI